MEKELFKFKTTVRVRTYEVDWQGIVHNTVYMLYCEIGRVEYLNHIGASLDLNDANSGNRVVLSRNEIDYISPARFNTEIEIYTRIAEIGNSSFVFEGLLIDGKNHTLIGKNRAFHVWLHPDNGRPARVPDNFRDLVRKHEGTNLSEKAITSKKA